MKLIKPIHIVGVMHTRRGVANAIKYLHTREPVQQIRHFGNGTIMLKNFGQKLDLNTPSRCNGMKIGLELGEKELMYIQEFVKTRKNVGEIKGEELTF